MRSVVITGIGAVSPNGMGLDSFKHSLLAGKSGITRITAFDPSDLACQVAGIVSFNGHAWSDKEKRNLPRVTQLAWIASREAFRNANLCEETLDSGTRRRFGVLIGTGGGSAEFMERHYEMLYGKAAFHPSVYAVPAATAGSISSEISIRLQLFGKSHVITTGCTSSTDAIGYAYQDIREGRLDLALAGGTDAPVTPGAMRGFTLMKVLSTHFNHIPEKASRPFSRDRDGFVPSEGAWMFVLEEKNHALRRGAKIYSEITGYGSSCEAFHSVRLEESGGGNFQALELAFEDAGIRPEEIDYVNLHGTSTELNDRVETAAMKSFFGRNARRIPMSSTKSMIGHPQGASGAAGMAATLLCMQDNKIHATLNLDHPDPECGLDYVPHAAREHKIRYALCNTLGFGSKCSVLLLKNHAWSR